MDGACFDRITKILTTRASRRTTVALAAGLVGLAGVNAFDVSAQRKKKHKKPCAVCKQRKHGKCKPAPDGTACGTCKTCQVGSCDDAPDGTECGGGQICANGGCACPSGEQTCGGVCVDLATDPSHCGSCGNNCTSDAGACIHGACVCSGSCSNGCNCSEAINSDGTLILVCQAGKGDGNCATNDNCALGSACIVDDQGNPSGGGHCGMPC
jgi:hypothetical protein